MSWPAFAYLDDPLVTCQRSHFSGPQAELLAFDEKGLMECLARIPFYQAQGFYCVGYVAYEAGYCLNPALKSLFQESSQPILHFVVFAHREFKPLQGVDEADKVRIEAMVFEGRQADYFNQFNVVQHHLTQGNSYQVNLTKTVTLDGEFNSLAFYQALSANQAVEYAAFMPYSPVTVLSLSPELFIKKRAETLTVKPMKGTFADQSVTPDDKNKTENLIVVDLMRNDLSKLCEVGSVTVQQAFLLEHFDSVSQLSSVISGRCDKALSFEALLKALFPSGSITGAPKEKTMEIIHQLEAPRGVYTGMIGVIEPNNDLCFNVAIRTLTHTREGYKMGVGGGVTLQSSVVAEWAELGTKLNFCRKLYQPSFELVESLRFYKKFGSLEAHLNRLNASAAKFLFDIDLGNIRQALLDYANGLDEKTIYKVRLVVDNKGCYRISHESINSHHLPFELLICPEFIDSSNVYLAHKTTHASSRGLYADMQQRYVKETYQELLFVNEKHQLTESRYHNVVIELDGQLLTPHRQAGLLCGVYRQFLLDSKDVSEAVIEVDTLFKAQGIYLINDVRGMQEGVLKGWAMR